MKCRSCNTELEHLFLDLGTAPPSNAYLTAGDLQGPELFFPLRLFVCHHCWLVQTEDYNQAEELFDKDYAYFSSTSLSWLDHAKRYCDSVTKRLGLNEKSFVVELASNDGYLLKNFVASGVPCLGIEPTASTAAAAEASGVPVLREFFGEELAKGLVAKGSSADLIIGNNVYAHVPDIVDFTRGMRTLLKPDGCITLEFPHLLELIKNVQFDTVYHEHFSYLSLSAVQRIFEVSGLRVWDVEQLPTHGGSLRVYGCRAEDPRPTLPSVDALIQSEISGGLSDLSTYAAFQARAVEVKNDFIAYLLKQRREGKQVAAYGAAAKGNTFLNFAGIRSDLLSFVCDAAPSKQSKFMPGSRIPILHPDVIREKKPDVVVILPWNIADEVVQQHAYIKDWGGRFAVAIPEVRELP